MTLISSQSMTPAARLTNLVAARNIVRRNAHGQTVVVVPKGQLIPEGLEVEDREVAGKRVDTPVENKARGPRPTPKAPRPVKD